MKLLNAGTLELEEFVSDIPPYAILSHTWGPPQDEVLYTDITSSCSPSQSCTRCGPAPGTRDAQLPACEETPVPWTSKKGFRKIRFSASQALSDSLSYLWIDTLCIDKSSSAELSEAINSMFAYYAAAEVCYVYLEDVSLQPPEEFGERLSHARWFSRGWTLQELLASRVRFFFDEDWNVIGRITPEERDPGDSIPGTPLSPTVPSRLRSRVLDIDSLEGFPLSVALDTMLPLDLLVHRTTLDDYSVADKMRWASARCTTRAEDAAYCLLGIFGVNMPLLYGEGGDRAFNRLQEEIIKRQHDHSLFLWKRHLPPLGSHSGMLAASAADFASWNIGQVAAHRHHPELQRPYAITNRGLSIRLPLVPTGAFPGEYIAGLNCHPVGSPGVICCVILVEIGPRDQFARVDLRNDNLESFDTKLESFLAASSMRDIFVHQKIVLQPDHNTPRLERFFIQPPPRALQLLQLAVRDVSPADCWEPASWTVTLPKFPLEPLRHGVRTACLAFRSLSGRTYFLRIRAGFDIDGGTDLSLSSSADINESIPDDLDELDWQPTLELVRSSVRRGATFPMQAEVDNGHGTEEVHELSVSGTTRMVDGQAARVVTLSVALKRKVGGETVSSTIPHRGRGSLRPQRTF